MSNFISWIRSLFGNIRFYVLVFSSLLSAGLYFWVKTYIPGEELQTIRLTQLYAFCALIFLYLALLAGPFVRTFQSFPWKGQYIKARRAIGVSAFFFAASHARLAFFDQLGGFEGLPFLGSKYLIAIGLSSTALFILFLMAATSFDYMIDKLTFSRWKALHRMVYFAGIFIIIHALMLGTHYANISQLIPQISFAALAFLLVLEALQTDKLLSSKYSRFPKGILLIVTSVLLTAIYMYFIFPSNGLFSFGVHAEHIRIAKQIQSGDTISSSPVSKIPGLTGDRTKRFTVDFDYPEQIELNQEVELTFSIYDASNGNKVLYFSKPYEKAMHLIVVDRELFYFEHIHPTQEGSHFKIKTHFPHEGEYRVYIDFQPIGAIEQQVGFSLAVGAKNTEEIAQSVDTSLSKTVQGYEVTLDHPTPLKAKQVSQGEQLLTFTIKDKMGNPVTTLKPYLASFGHLVMINSKTFDYLHVHPTNLVAPKPNETSGPSVAFMPLGLYSPIKPGQYRAFAEFNPNGELIRADYTIIIN